MNTDRPNRSPLTVIILTFNEEENLDAALESVTGWASQVFVVDSFSTDRTVDIALARRCDGVQVIQHAFENYGAQWNFALTNLPINQPWILKLDADERATPEFRSEVDSKLCAPNTEESSFTVHWRLIFMGRWLKWGGLYPNGNTRLWRAGAARFERRDVNEHAVVEGKRGEIKAPIDHWDLKDLGHWLDRHNRYSALEARSILQANVIGETQPRFFGRPDERRMWLRRLYYALPGRSVLYFLYRYVLRLGFLDGKAGFRYICLHAFFLYWIDLKREESKLLGRSPSVIWPPRGVPHPRLSGNGLASVLDSPISSTVGDN